MRISVALTLVLWPTAAMLGAHSHAQCTITASYAAVNSEPWEYTAPPIEAHSLQTYRLFVPPSSCATKPTEGWPVLIISDLAFYDSTDDYATVDPCTGSPCPPHIASPYIAAALQQGIAVVAVRFTTSWPSTSSSPYKTNPAVPGHGMFHPPGYEPPGQSGTPIIPYEEVGYDMPEKDAVMIIQHVRYLARDSTSAADMHFPELQREKMAELDHRRIAVIGSSAGANSFMWAAFGPDRRLEEPFLHLSTEYGGQWAEWTRPDIAAFGSSHVWLPYYPDAYTYAPMHWAKFDPENPSIPVDPLEDAATSLGDADINELFRGSPLFYEDCTLNGGMPTYMFDLFPTSISPSFVLDYEKNASGCPTPLPFCFDNSQATTQYHPVWNSIAWWVQYNHVAVAVPPDDSSSTKSTFDEAYQAGVTSIRAAGYFPTDFTDWLRDEFDAAPDPWTPITQVPIPGQVNCVEVLSNPSGEYPLLTASGPLIANEAVDWTVTAWPDSDIYLLLNLALDPASLPSFGGYTVLDIFTPFETFSSVDDTDGVYTVHIEDWPPGLTQGFSMYMQAFVYHEGQWTLSVGMFGVAP